MALERVNYAPAMLRDEALASALDEHPFTLLDIGCSGGLDVHWREFGEHLRAVGVDPLNEECRRLADAETSPTVRYVAAWIAAPDFEQKYPRGALELDPVGARNDQSIARTSSRAAILATGFDGARHFSQGAPTVTYAERRLSVDELAAEAGLETVDFLKVDTDGFDLEVLVSADETLRSRNVLGASIEVQFHAPIHDYSNCFSNIDRLMRGHGFSLFDLDVYRYSRAALPDRFVYDIPAQTHRGQLGFGEALYVRDLGDSKYPAMWGALPPASLLKALFLFELFGLNDCAAEVILNNEAALSPLIDTRRALDVLAREWWPRAEDYHHLAEAFVADPAAFMKSGRAMDPEPPPEPPAVEVGRRLRLLSGRFRR
ncbi:MAG: FkbM family methyltransferase [Chloroflexi bacterium]|nr:FkbM family methyltransferase [Chloroflexota bacterium]